MLAARFHSDSRELRIEDVSIPQPAPDEVLVRVHACGICLSDVHMIDGTLPPSLPVVTPGHEAAGEVVSVGREVRAVHPGQRVVMAGGKPCFACAACVSGRWDRCRNLKVMGFGYDGAWAEYVVVPSAVVSVVPDNVPLEQAAILADAVTTPYAALVGRARLEVGESIGLWGIGGLGVHAVRIARLVGAGIVIAIDPRPAARAHALAAGADLAIDPVTSDVRGEIDRFTDHQGLDVAVDLVGSNAVLVQAESCLGQGGRVIMVGLSLEPIELGIGVLFGIAAHSLIGHIGYSKDDLDHVVGLVASGRLDVSASVSGLVPLADVADGVRRLRDRVDDPIRLVITP